MSAHDGPANDNGGAAFPLSVDQTGDGFWYEGMSLRDYFAAQAMIGLTLRPWNATADAHHAMVATAAYDYADAMLKERAR